MGKQYDRKEVEEILRRALVQHDGDAMSHEDLLAAAAEVGIPADAIENAALELRRDRLREAHRARILARRRGGFGRHLGAFLAVNLALFFLDVAAGPGWWFHIPACAWGIGLFFHGMGVFLPSERRLQRQVDRAIRREEVQAARTHRRSAPADKNARAQERAATLRRIVDDGVDLVLDQMASQLDRQHRKNKTRVRVDPSEPTDDPDRETRSRRR